MQTRLSRPAGSALLIAVIAVFGSSTGLQAAERGTIPRSALPGVQPLDAIELRGMPGIDVASLLAEDAERENTGVPVAPRFAKKIPVALTTANSGTWETLSDGSRLWRIRVNSPGALSLNLGLERFDLPDGAAFWVHAPDGSGVQGPYTQENRNGVGGLWTAVVLGDEMVAELLVPKGGEADIRISSVNHGYRFFGQRDVVQKRGSCNINVVCPQGDPWRDQIRSVARISISGMFLCTAQLVNNTAEDLTPYLLTAQHCIEQSNEAPSVVVYWNYQSPECDDTAGGNLSQNQSGSTFISSSEFEFGSDFTLVELDDMPQASFNVYYSGWDARDQVPESTTTIHHPAGDEKSISFDYDPPTVTSLGGSSSPGDGTYLRVADWDEATTEDGSSGGCLFDDSTQRCVGTLSGGFAACGNDQPDWYGRFYSHWTGDGTPGTRLSDWLDPLGGDTLFLDGKNGMGVGTQETWLIPAVASLMGKSTSDWKSQIGVANPSTEQRSVSVFFVAKDEVWPGQLLSGPHSVGPNQSLYIDDPLLPLNPTSGILYVTVDGSGTAVFVRTYNLLPNGSTFGQGQPGISLDSTKSEAELILPIIHSAPGVFRTNVGFAQTSAGTFQVKVEIYSAGGTLLAQKNYSQAAAWRQINDIFKNMDIGDQVVEGGWIRVTLVTGSPAFWTTYATVIDDTTDDPTYVLPVAP